jgi:protein-disulfide isomerase
MTTEGTNDMLAVPVGERDHTRGSASAPVTLVQYGDYECPYTRRSQPIVRGLEQRLGERLRFVFRHFPLSRIHPHAEAAAEAAEAAEAQGRFWAMHDYLFAHQRALEEEDLAHYAADLGLDRDRFAADLAGHVHAPRVQNDLVGGIRSGVQGTPTFFINGARHEGAYDLETLLAAIEAAGTDGTLDEGRAT